MNPKKAKETAVITAAEMNLDPDMVEDIIGFYWKTLRKELSKVEHPYVRIDSIGTFRVKRKKLDKVLINKERMLSLKTVEAFEKYPAFRIKVENAVQRLKDMIEYFKKENADRKQFNIDKKNGKFNKDLEK